MQTSLRTITPQFTLSRITLQPELLLRCLRGNRQRYKYSILCVRSPPPDARQEKHPPQLAMCGLYLYPAKQAFKSCQTYTKLSGRVDVSDCVYKGSENRRSPSQPPMEGRIDTASVSTVPQITRHALIEGQSRSGVKRDY
jgi:hypothetical protein